MNNTQKILIAIGVGVGVAYLYNRYKKGKKTTAKAGVSSPTTSSLEISLPDDVSSIDMSREEKEEYILDNVSASTQEITSGFEGTKFVWNPTLGKMYPVGTIVEGEEPAYVDAVFMSAEGDVVADIPNSVSNAEKSLTDLTDQELELLFRLVKKMKENPSVKTEEDAVKELGVTNPKIIQVVKEKLKKRLNDIKIMKKDLSWKDKWEMRREMRIKRRKDFKDRMGFPKGMLDKAVRKQCGRKPKRNQVAQYKKCVETIANKMRNKIKNEIRAEVSNAPVSVKEEINDRRQKQFAQQVAKRTSGGMSAGKRWDGKSNEKVESMVDMGLV